MVYASMESEITVDLLLVVAFLHHFGTLVEIFSGSGRRRGQQQDYYVNPGSCEKRRPDSDRPKQTRREPQHQRERRIASPSAAATGGGFTRAGRNIGSDEDD